jgi:hypothetical protein|tara:strand:+ start:800 stop:1111 length:312 start_codon:yes stop_codon:yes gene_type:complete
MMTTKYEIPAFIRRARKDPNDEAKAVQHYSQGYADAKLTEHATQLRAIASTYLNDITNRKLIHTDPEYAVETIDLALRELNLALDQLTNTQVFIKNNLVENAD